MFYNNDCQLVKNHLGRCDACLCNETETENEPESAELPNESTHTSSLSFRQLPPNKNFKHIFKIRNSGSQNFPPNSRFRVVSGADIFINECDKSIKLPELPVGGIVEISINLKSAGNVGFYETNWRVYNEGYYFGEEMSVRHQVVASSEMQ